MSIEDQPTQQIRRPEAPTSMPGPLNPTYQPPTPAAETPESGSTEVLSLDELLDGPATTSRPSPAATRPVAATPASVAPPSAPVARTASPAAPAAPRIGAVPVHSAQESPTAGSSSLRGDAAAAWRGGVQRSRAWLTAGDNKVIVATVLIALFLLLAVALF